MRLGDVMTRELPCLGPGDNVRAAARTMADLGIKALPVCEDGALVGILTDWDVTVAVAEHGDTDAIAVRHAMSPDVIYTDPAATLDEASELMGEHRLHHLCVCEDGRYCGMVHLDVGWSQLGGQDVQAPQATFTAPV